MGITFRQYGSADLKLVSDFLIVNFQPGNQDSNWLQPAWEYMHSHPSLDESSLMWYEPVNKIAYVEPVATDPDFRRMGLGKAAVWEGIRRCGVLGATVAYVGSDQEFYKAIGFTKRFDSNCWVRHF